MDLALDNAYTGRPQVEIAVFGVLAILWLGASALFVPVRRVCALTRSLRFHILVPPAFSLRPSLPRSRALSLPNPRRVLASLPLSASPALSPLTHFRSLLACIHSPCPHTPHTQPFSAFSTHRWAGVPMQCSSIPSGASLVSLPPAHLSLPSFPPAHAHTRICTNER